jgi:hypothetical protein
MEGLSLYSLWFLSGPIWAGGWRERDVRPRLRPLGLKHLTSFFYIFKFNLCTI